MRPQHGLGQGRHAGQNERDLGDAALAVSDAVGVGIGVNIAADAVELFAEQVVASLRARGKGDRGNGIARDQCAPCRADPVDAVGVARRCHFGQGVDAGAQPAEGELAGWIAGLRHAHGLAAIVKTAQGDLGQPASVGSTPLSWPLLSMSKYTNPDRQPRGEFAKVVFDPEVAFVVAIRN